MKNLPRINPAKALKVSLPYLIAGLLCTKLGEAYRLTTGGDVLDIHFPIVELAAALARSTMTVKRSLNELEDAGLILRVRQGFGEPNKI